MQTMKVNGNSSIDRNDVVFHIHEFVREKCINYFFGFAWKASKLDFQGVDW